MTTSRQRLSRRKRHRAERQAWTMPQQAKPQEKVAVTLSEKMEGMTLFEETKDIIKQEDARHYQGAAIKTDDAAKRPVAMESQLRSETLAEQHGLEAAEEQAQRASNQPIAIDARKVWARADAWRERRMAERAVDAMFKEMRGMTLTEIPKVRIKLEGARKRPRVLKTVEVEDEAEEAEKAEKDRIEQQEWRKRVAAEHNLSPEEVKKTAAIWFGKRCI